MKYLVTSCNEASDHTKKINDHLNYFTRARYELYKFHYLKLENYNVKFLLLM